MRLSASNDPGSTKTYTLTKLEHDLIHHVAQAPTCTVDGHEAGQKCTRCKAVEGCEVITKLNHNYEKKDGKAATCIEDGYTDYEECSICHDIKGKETIKSNGQHDFGEWYVTEEATCQDTGLQRRDCKNCNHYEVEVIPKEKNHQYVMQERIAPTCTEQGYDLALCKWCNKERHQHLVDPLGHDFENGTEIKRVEPTCTKDGYYVMQCSRCNATETYTLNATGHKYGEWYTSKEPTCTELGYERRDCQNEGCHSYQSHALNELGHKLIDVPKKDSTCTEDGYEAYKKCTRCEYTEGYEVIPAKGHDFTVHVKGSDTYESKDKTSHTHYWTNKCSRCEETEIEQEVLKHNFVMVDDKKPTCEEKGYTTYKCKECNYKYTAEVSALGHSYGNLTKEIVKAPTTESEGRYEEVKYCERCNDRYVINSGIIPKLEKEEPAPLPAAPAAPAKTDKKPVETKVTETEETVSDVTEAADTEETVTEEIAEEVVPEAAPEITKEEETPEVTKAAAEEPTAEAETETEETNAFCWWWLLLILLVLIIVTSIVIYVRRKNNARR